jgi:large subunit ribosomal protein L15
LSVRHEKRSRKYRGTRSVGWGRIGQHRKAGSKGGVGRAGLHKHKWSWTVKYGKSVFGKHGFKRSWNKAKVEVINVDQLEELVRKTNSDSVNLSDYGVSKLLGRGTVSRAVQVKVDYASKEALEKIKRAGGKVELLR